MSILKAMLQASAGLGDPFWMMAPHARASAQATAEETQSSDEPLGIIELDENLADVDKPPEVPAGAYIGEVQDVQINTSQNKGNKYFAVKFVIPPDELPADLRDDFPDGAVLYWNRNLVPTKADRRAKFNLRKLIEALGLDSNVSTVDPNEWMGRPAKLRIVMGKWQGEDRAEIRSVEPAESAPPARTQQTRTEQTKAGGSKPRPRK